MRVTSALSCLLDLSGVWVRSVCLEPDRVVVAVALRRRRLVCPRCSYSTRHRESRQRHQSSWRPSGSRGLAPRGLRHSAAAALPRARRACGGRPVRPRRRALHARFRGLRSFEWIDRSRPSVAVDGTRDDKGCGGRQGGAEVQGLLPPRCRRLVISAATEQRERSRRSLHKSRPGACEREPRRLQALPTPDGRGTST